MVKHTLLSGFLLFCLNCLFGQRPYQTPENEPLLDKWRIKQIDELKSERVTSMDVDGEGNMWFASDRSVLKYDGYKWKYYKLNGAYGHKFGIKIIKTPKHLYLLMAEGLFRYEGKKWQPLYSMRVQKQKKDFWVGDMVNFGGEEDVLVSTAHGLLFISDTTSFFYTRKEKVGFIKKLYPNYNVKSLSNKLLNQSHLLIRNFVQISDNEVWAIPNQRKAIKIKSTGNLDNPLIFKQTKHKVSHRSIGYGLKASDGKIWLSSEAFDRPIYYFEDGQFKSLDLREKFGVTGKNSSIVEAEDGTILIGGSGNLITIKGDKFKIYSSAQLPIAEQTVKLAMDKLGNLWMGTFGGKYFIVDYSSNNWETYKNLFFQFEDMGKKWFISSDDKIVIQEGEKWYYYDQSDGVIDAPTRVIKLRNGDIWCAGSHMTNAATAFLRNGKWEKQQHPKLGWAFEKKSVYEDKNGNLWLGTHIRIKGIGGVLKLSYKSLDDLNWEHIDVMPNKMHVSGGFVENAKGQILYGGFHNVHGIDNGKYIDKGGIKYPGGVVRGIEISAQKTLWVAGQTRGVWAFYENGKTKKFGIKEGLVSNAAIGIYAPTDTTVWVATDEDFSYYDGKEWTANCLPKEHLIHAVAGEISGDKNGNLWILNMSKEWALRGQSLRSDKLEYDKFISVKYKRDTMPPETTIKRYNKEVASDGNTHIIFEGTDYWNRTSKDRLMFSYKLNKGKWSKFSYSNTVSFYGLEDGEYRFQVRAKDKEFNTDLTPARAYFVVAPPVWKQTWFIALMMVLLSTIVYMATRIMVRNRSLAQLNTSLNKSNDELAERNEHISSQKEEINQQAEELMATNEAVSQQADELRKANDGLEEQKAAIIKSYDSIKALGLLGQEITSVLDVDDINRTIGGYIEKLLDTDSHGIGLYSKRREELFFSNFMHFDREKEPFVASVNDPKSLSALCFRDQKDVVSGNLAKEYGDFIARSPEIDFQKVPGSVVYVPLMDKGNAVGVLVIHSKLYDAYDEQDIGIIKNLASYVSVAITNANSYTTIKQKNIDINNSINYAQTIQQAILPLRERIRDQFDYFSIFLPKDVVSGDFYWFSITERQDGSILSLFAVIDCTGHGVPGAIMSIVSNGALNRIVNERLTYEPSQILEALDLEIRTILKQEQTENNDGMDVCLCSFEETKKGNYNVRFSASKRPLYIYRQQSKELMTYKGTRRYIGGARKGNPLPFEAHEFELTTGDVLYLSSDGYVDQNSLQRERCGSRRLTQLLETIGDKVMAEQQTALLDEFEKHKQSERQRDDVTFVGLKLK